MSEPASSYHTPVLLRHTIDLLVTDRSGVYVDGTLGGGGHAEAILQRLTDHALLIGLDRDADALAFAASRLERFAPHLMLCRENFRDLKNVLSEAGIGSVTGVLLDLGVSSFQLDEPGKGFSFRGDDPLDMRMDQRQSFTAEEVVNEYDTNDLVRIIRTYGEEREAFRIARAITGRRVQGRIVTTGELALVIEKTVGGKFLTKTLARVFQAIRIEVNGELENLRRVLDEAVEALAPGGRIVVISYHSLEDRIVKEFFRSASAVAIPSGHKLLPDTPLVPRLTQLTKKPVTADDEEVRNNPRARSAKLRAAERI